MLYIIIALFVFGLLIFIHELGHFLCARACGVAIKEFAIGMGPNLFSWKSKKYDTVYGEKIGVLGSVNEFGNWNENNVCVLNWNCNNYWKGCVEFETIPKEEIEFKFVVI